MLDRLNINIEDLQTNAVVTKIITSILLVVGVLVLRHLLARTILRTTGDSLELRRKLLVQTRNGFVLLVFLGLMVIWAAELRLLALSLLAVLAAVVLATRELILCLTGGLLKSSSRSFRIGDRIEVTSLRGDVIDQSLLTTTILEIGPGQLTHQHTGRAIILPNSLFLTAAVVNESFTDDFVLHVFSVPIKTEEDWRQAEEQLLQAARTACAPFIEQARSHMNRLAAAQGLEAPSVDPRVTLQLPEPGRINLLVRVPVPARRKGRLEQEILRRYLAQRPRETRDEDKVKG